jgi:cytochrome bd-type quinol oxidase subunit 2
MTNLEFVFFVGGLIAGLVLGLVLGVLIGFRGDC